MAEQTPSSPGTPPPLTPSQTPPPEADPRKKSVGDLVFDVTEGTSSLIREEFELAKAEVSEKLAKLLRGSVVGVAAGVFAFLALILVMEGIAWLLNEEVFDGKTWPGFFIEAAVFLLIAALAGFVAYRAVRAGSPPVPGQAKLTRSMFEREASSAAENVEHSIVKGGGK